MNLVERYLKKILRKKYGFKIGQPKEGPYRDKYTIIKDDGEVQPTGSRRPIMFVSLTQQKPQLRHSDNLIARELGMSYEGYFDLITDKKDSIEGNYQIIVDTYDNSCIYFENKSDCIAGIDRLCEYLERR